MAAMVPGVPRARHSPRAKQYLYPSEFLQFVSCDRVTLRWRQAAAIAIYTCTRDAELRLLRWSDVERGIVEITRAFNRRNPSEVKATKGPLQGHSLAPVHRDESQSVEPILRRRGAPRCKAIAIPLHDRALSARSNSNDTRQKRVPHSALIGHGYRKLDSLSASSSDEKNVLLRAAP